MRTVSAREAAIVPEAERSGRGGGRLLTFHVSRFAFCVLLVTCLSACTVLRQTRPVVKIGLVAPFEGRYRYVGYDAIYAARLALQAANAAGGVGGYSVELVAYDDQGRVAGAEMAARNLVQDPQVVAVVGHFGDETTAAAQALYDQAGLPLIVAGTVGGQVGRQADWLCTLLAYLGEGATVQWMGEAPSAESPPACANDLGWTASGEIPPPPGVDVVLLALDPVAAGETLVALREAGWGRLVAGGPVLGSPLFAQIAGEMASGVVFAAPYRWPEITGDDAAFSQAYQALGPHVPPPGPFALTTYQATQAFLNAIETTAREGKAPSRQSLAPHLGQPSAVTVRVYRWNILGALELVGP